MDCLEGMGLIKDKSIDMILCDLPYGTTRNKWDTVLPFKVVWSHYERIIKDNGAIVLTAQTPFDKVLGCSNLKLLRYEWIWEKEFATGFLNANRMPLKKHENILVFYKKSPVYNPQFTSGKPYKAGRSSYTTNYGKFDPNKKPDNSGFRYPKSVLQFKHDQKRLHPTQKPVALFEYLIRTYTDEGDTVLDNCMGSGTTAIACIKANRNFIGFEIQKEYVDIASNRLRQF